jgi:hypothetical protein
MDPTNDDGIDILSDRDPEDQLATENPERVADEQWLVRSCRRGAITCGALGLVALLFTLWELGLTLVSLGVLLFFVRRLVERSWYLEGALLVAFLGGYFISWCIGFLGYRYVLAYRGNEFILNMHTVVTAALVLVAVLASVAGGWAVLAGSRREPIAFGFEIDRRRVLGLLGWFGLIFAIYQAVSFAAVGFNARWVQGNVIAMGSVAFFLGGFRAAVLPFYTLLGLSLQNRLLTVWNGVVLIIVMGMVGVLGLAGGRELALEPIVLTFFGAVLSQLSWRKMAWLSILAVPVVVAVIIILGVVRTSSGFANGSIGGKVAAASSLVAKDPVMGDPSEDPMYSLFSRLFEPSGQTVIDHVAETGKRVCFLNVERLPFVLVPHFIYPQKASLNDGNQRMVSDYGYLDSEFTAVPMTQIADAYERFGFVGVALFHLMAGAILAYLGLWVCRPKSTLLVALLIGRFSYVALRLYAESNLGFFDVVIYSFLRDLLIIGALYFVGERLSGFFLGSKDKETAAAKDYDEADQPMRWQRGTR